MNMMGLISRACVKCETIVEIPVLGPDYEKWENGELIQTAMPYLSADEREVLISGVCGPCFDNMFGGEE